MWRSQDGGWGAASQGSQLRLACFYCTSFGFAGCGVRAVRIVIEDPTPTPPPPTAPDSHLTNHHPTTDTLTTLPQSIQVVILTASSLSDAFNDQAETCITAMIDARHHRSQLYFTSDETLNSGGLGGTECFPTCESACTSYTLLRKIDSALIACTPHALLPALSRSSFPPTLLGRS